MAFQLLNWASVRAGLFSGAVLGANRPSIPRSMERRTVPASRMFTPTRLAILRPISGLSSLPSRTCSPYLVSSVQHSGHDISERHAAFDCLNLLVRDLPVDE